jgi:hypothetical protein
MTKKRKTKVGPITQLEIYNKLRQTWEINPKTRVVPSKTKSRQQAKKEIQEELDSL